MDPMSSGNRLPREDGFACGARRRGGGGSFALYLRVQRVGQIRAIYPMSSGNPPPREDGFHAEARTGVARLLGERSPVMGWGSPTSESEIQGYRISRMDPAVAGTVGGIASPRRPPLGPRGSAVC
jgi:hypothetical protein